MSIKLALLLFYLFFLLALSGCKSAEIFLPYIYQLEAWLGGDKWMHFKLAAVLGVLAVWLAEGRKLVVLLTLFSLGIFIDEFHQYVLASRRFEWLDSLCGLAGLCAGSCGALLAKLAFVRTTANRRDN